MNKIVMYECTNCQRGHRENNQFTFSVCSKCGAEVCVGCYRTDKNNEIICRECAGEDTFRDRRGKSHDVLVRMGLQGMNENMTASGDFKKVDIKEPKKIKGYVPYVNFEHSIITGKTSQGMSKSFDHTLLTEENYGETPVISEIDKEDLKMVTEEVGEMPAPNK